MDLSIFLFRIFGFYFFIVGIACLFKREFFRVAIKDYYNNAGIILTTGLFTLILGLILVLNYNEWEYSAKGVVTLFAWLTVIKGITRLFFPYAGEQLAAKLLGGRFGAILGLLWIVIGVWLLSNGYANYTQFN